MNLPYKSLDLVPVEKILKPGENQTLRFWVPAYQRGYRWDEDQVSQLIDDLFVFLSGYYSNEDAFYCLQPVVVKETTITDPVTHMAQDYLEVIDGQQRLTTILILLQAIHQLKCEKFLSVIKGTSLMEHLSLVKDVYEIKYETRVDSTCWLGQLGNLLNDQNEYVRFGRENCDYYHFAEVFKTAYNRLKDIDFEEFEKVLRNRTYVIWFVPDSGTSGTNAEIFDRLNAGKIILNNAELIKALFLQKSNLDVPANYTDSDYTLQYKTSLLNSIALEWDRIEKHLQDKEFWGFIYSSNHFYSYDTHIEYLFDLLQDKKSTDALDKRFTFNKYLKSYRRMKSEQRESHNPKMRLDWLTDKWDKLKELYDTLTEWYKDRAIYHRVGYLLEYGRNCTVITLRKDLYGKKRDERMKILNDKIQDSLANIDWRKLFYKKAEMSQVLFIYNILLEDKRFNNTARFSFADYKKTRKDKGWNQEHVASNTDFDPKEAEKNELAADILELFTGQYIKRHGSGKNRIYEMDEFKIEQLMPDVTDEAKALCLEWQAVLAEDRSKLKEDETKMNDESLQSLYGRTLKLFESDKDPIPDTFQTSSDGRQYSGKDFIWNFVLLNASTNRSYGNNIFPVKRRRILRDEYDVYTPVGTRNVFEKATSTKSGQMLTWTRTDALAYWEDIRKVLKPYITLGTPFKN